MEEKVYRENEHGVMEGLVWHFDSIRMGHAVSRYKALAQFTGSSKDDTVRLHYGLRGDYKFHYHQLNRSYDLIGGHHNIMYTQGFDITVENKTPEVETFGVQYPRELFVQYTEHSNAQLQRFAADVLAGKNVMLSEHWGAIHPEIQNVIQQIIHCRYGGDLKRIFLLSKCIELLVLSAEAYNTAAKQGELFIKTKADKERIIAVRDLVNERASNPPNLSEIARSVGLNEYKLKRGFKETFHTTVFGYLTEQRMQLAHQFLLDTTKTAAEIAYELGYATPQHFSNAFKKKFGITPAAARK